jgi:hypothetical protein
MSKLVISLLATANYLSLSAGENLEAYPHISRVAFEVAEVQGEKYERKIEPMRMLDQTDMFNSPVCTVEQVINTSNLIITFYLKPLIFKT